MVKIIDNFSYNNNYYPETNKRKYITIHETANKSVGADAEAHANFINNGAMETWHYTVDSEKAICHYYHTTSCWHAGTYKGNTQSIGIEMCVNSDGNYLKTLHNTIELVQKIMKEENIPVNRVVQHHYWSGKHCPTLLREGKSGMNWEQFITGVKGKKVEKKKSTSKSEKSSWRFTVGGEQIETRIGSPKLSAKSGGHVQPKQKMTFNKLVKSDGFEWGMLTNNRGQTEYVPIRPLNKDRNAWGVLK